MTHEEVMAMMEEMNLPFAYDHFVEGGSPGLLQYSFIREAVISRQTAGYIINPAV